MAWAYVRCVKYEVIQKMTIIETLELGAGLKAAMRHLPSGVALLTTVDPETNAPVGIAISSVISVSMDPPSMLVAVNRSSSCHSVIHRSGMFCINLLNASDRDLVNVFSSGTRREERFTQDGWREKNGLRYLAGATALFCRTAEIATFGTHDVFIGEVVDLILAHDPQPLGWMRGDFHQMVPFL